MTLIPLSDRGIRFSLPTCLVFITCLYIVEFSMFILWVSVASPLLMILLLVSSLSEKEFRNLLLRVYLSVIIQLLTPSITYIHYRWRTYFDYLVCFKCILKIAY